MWYLMFEVLSSLLMHKQIVFDKGRISIFGRPSSLLPTDSFVKIQKFLESKNLENIIYYSAKESGYKWFEEMSKSYSLKGKDVIEWGSKIVTLAGWGEAVIKKRLDQEKIVDFLLRDAIVPKLYGSSTRPVDHMFRGLVCGAMNFIFKEELEAVEIKCMATGNPECEFIIKKKSDFDYSNDLVKKQLFNPAEDTK